MMSVENNKSEPQRLIEQNLRERMASLEATNNFHRETLNDISVSLKEVVKTQHVLANQRDEITKLIKSVADIQTEMINSRQHTFEMSFKVDEQAKAVRDMTAKYEALATKVGDNSNFVKLSTKIISAIIVPMILAIILQFLKTS